MVWLTKLLLKVGESLSKRFPEMMSVKEMAEKLKKYESESDIFHRGLEALEMRLASIEAVGSDIEKLKADVQKLQTLAVIKAKTVASYTGNMNPSNWPLPPVMPGPP